MRERFTIGLSLLPSKPPLLTWPGLVNFLSRRAAGATARRQQLESKMDQAKQQGRGNIFSTKLNLARQAEKQVIQLTCNIKILTQWLSHDILALAGSALEERQELFDFIVEELSLREALCPHRLRPVRTALSKRLILTPKVSFCLFVSPDKLSTLGG